MTRGLRLALCAVVFSSAACLAQSINIKGSTTLQPAADKWAAEYAKLKPGVKIRVLGGGSATGFQALEANEADLAASSRKIEPKESADISAKRGKQPVEYKVAIDGVAIFVNADNPVQKLTVQQLADVLSGKIKNWSGVGGRDLAIKIYGRDANSGTYGFVKEHVLKGQPFAAGAAAEPSSVQVIAGVESDAAGLGYGSIEFGKKIRHLRIAASADSQAVAPELASIRSGDYPLTRGLYFYSAGSASSAARDFLKFVASDQGQAVLDSLGLYSLSGRDRSKLESALQ